MKVFFIGPSSGKTTGQSIAFNAIWENYIGKKILFDYQCKGTSTISKILHNLNLFVLFFFKLLASIFEKKVVYITTSRTMYGFVRDAYFILFSRAFGARVVNHLHGADFNSFRDSQNKFLKGVIDIIYKNINDSIVLLPKMVEQYKNYPMMKLHVVSNCYYGYELTNVKIKKMKDIKLKVLYLSNIMYSKGILHLICAIKELSSEGYDIELTIAGNFMSDEYYSAFDIQLKFESETHNVDNIKYIGSVNTEEKMEIYRQADVFVLPSFYRSEAQPISIIEAMSFGCVIVTTNHNYLPDMINAHGGILVEKESISAIKNALIELCNSRHQYSGFSAFNIKMAQSEYSPSTYIQRISKIVNED
jgi:glycosyltransferase involved in cell wall biosynthesis